MRALSSNEPRSGGAGDGGLGVTYKRPVPGGRRGRSGEDVKWEIVGPEYAAPGESGGSGKGARGPADVPFFCHDVTEREVRVPRVPEGGHPSGAEGVKVVEVLVGRERVGAYVDLYTSVLGVEGREREDGDWEFPLRAPGAQDVTGVVRLRAARTEEDERYLKQRGVGVTALVIGLKGGGELRLPIAEYYLHGLQDLWSMAANN